jgi:hypothetical protein
MAPAPGKGACVAGARTRSPPQTRRPHPDDIRRTTAPPPVPRFFQKRARPPSRPQALRRSGREQPGTRGAMLAPDVSPVKYPTGGKFCELGGGKSHHFANQSRILSI